MRIFRLLSALVLAAGLALLPVSAAMAMTHAAKPDMGMGASMSASADDCQCCNAVELDACPLACCHFQVLNVEGLAIARPMSGRLVGREAETVVWLALRPDPPPPRS